MARGFGATDGSGTTDRILSATTPGTACVYSCWFYITGAGGGGLGRIFDAGADSCYYASGSSIIEFFSAFSGDDGTWNVPVPSSNEWHHLLLSYNSTDVANDPSIWIDGVSQSVTQTTTPTGTHNANGNLAFGNRNGTANRAWNGRLAEGAFWEDSFAQRAIDFVAALAAGMSPEFIPGQSLYLPMLRDNVNRRGAAPTITGTAVQPHPRQTHPRRKNFWPAAGLVAYEIIADGGTYTITGADATLELVRTVSAEAGTYTITGADAALILGKDIAAEAGTYTITGANVSLDVTRQIIAEAGTYAITGANASLDVTRQIIAEAGVYSITGANASLDVTRQIIAEAGVYAITGADAGLLTTRTITIDGGTYVIIGADASLEHDADANAFEIIAEAGTYAITGADAGLLAGFTVLAEGGTYAITGADAGLLAGYSVLADGGTYAITGAAVDFLQNRVLGANSGAYLITGAATTVLTWSGEEPAGTVQAYIPTFRTRRGR